jgi:hypothetical protein
MSSLHSEVSLCTPAVIEMKSATSISSPGPNNSLMSWLTASLILHSRIFVHLLPACRVYIHDATGYLTSHETHTLRIGFAEYELRAYIKKATIGQAMMLPISRPAYRSASALLTDHFRTFVVMAGYQSNFGNVNAALRLTSAPSAPNPRPYTPHLYLCQPRTTWHDRFITQLQKHLNMHVQPTYAASLYRISRILCRYVDGSLGRW